MTEKYLCAWGDGYADAPTARFLVKNDFSEENGWTDEMRIIISRLRVYQTADFSDYGGDLFVSRVQ